MHKMLSWLVGKHFIAGISAQIVTMDFGKVKGGRNVIEKLLF